MILSTKGRLYYDLILPHIDLYPSSERQVIWPPDLLIVTSAVGFIYNTHSGGLRHQQVITQLRHD